VTGAEGGAVEGTRRWSGRRRSARGGRCGMVAGACTDTRSPIGDKVFASGWRRGDGDSSRSLGLRFGSPPLEIALGSVRLVLFAPGLSRF
jgi:hypothetical protein